MFATYLHNRKCVTPRLSSIKAQFDSKVNGLLRILNSVPEPSKQDKVCQTDWQIQQAQIKQQNWELNEKSIDREGWRQSIHSTEVKSNTSSSRNFEVANTSQSINTGLNTRSDYKNKSINKSFASDLTPNKERAKSKISNKNQTFEKLLKQRKKQSPSKQLERVNQPVRISTNIFEKFVQEISLKNNRDRYQSDEGYQLRRKTFNKIIK